MDGAFPFVPHGAKWSFLKWNGNSMNSANSGNLISHRSMNLDQFQDPVSGMFLPGPVGSSWSLTQEVIGSYPLDNK